MAEESIESRLISAINKHDDYDYQNSFEMIEQIINLIRDQIVPPLHPILIRTYAYDRDNPGEILIVSRKHLIEALVQIRLNNLDATIENLSEYLRLMTLYFNRDR